MRLTFSSWRRRAPIAVQAVRNTLRQFHHRHGLAGKILGIKYDEVGLRRRQIGGKRKDIAGRFIAPPGLRGEPRLADRLAGKPPQGGRSAREVETEQLVE